MNFFEICKNLRNFFYFGGKIGGMSSKVSKNKIVGFCCEKTCECQKIIVTLHSVFDTASKRSINVRNHNESVRKNTNTRFRGYACAFP